MGKQDQDSRGGKNKCKKILKDNLLIIFMIIAVIIGVVLGLGLRNSWNTYDKRKIHFLRFPGDLLMNMLKMLILPLIVSSLISSLASLDSKASGRMGVRAVIYYLTTTISAVIIGIILVLSIQPGHKGDKKINKSGQAKDSHPIDALMDLIRNCFPNNLVSACFEKQVTEVGKYEVQLPTVASMMNSSMANMTENMTTTEAPSSSFFVDDPKVVTGSGMNVLGLVVFSIFFGCVISKMEEKGKPLADFFEALHIASMKLVTLVIW